MLGTLGNEDVLILSPHRSLVMNPHRRGATDNHPVLRPMMVQLKRQLGPRLDNDPFDSESVAHRDRFITAPWPVAFRALLYLAATAIAQHLDYILDLLAVVLVCHKNSVRRRNHDGVFQSDRYQ